MYECLCCGAHFYEPSTYGDSIEMWGGYVETTEEGCPICGGSYSLIEGDEYDY